MNERRILSAARPADAALLGHRGVMAGPLVDGHAPARVIGMLAIGGASLDDYPDDIERRFSVAAAELSRLAGRIGLLDQWRAAAAIGQAAGQSNGRAADRAVASPRAESAPAAGPAKGGREITLQ